MPALFDSDQTNNLRLMYWVVSLEAANGDLNAAIWIYRLMRLMYGDAPAACYLKLGLRRIIAPQCKTQLGRQILSSDRYVDDVLSEVLIYGYIIIIPAAHFKMLKTLHFDQP